MSARASASISSPVLAELEQIREHIVRWLVFAGLAFHQGIETHELDGVPVRIYDQEKTLVDCFRYRNQLGMDVVLEPCGSGVSAAAGSHLRRRRARSTGARPVSRRAARRHRL